MPYLRVEIYRVDDAADQAIQAIGEGLLPIFARQAGFLHCDVVEAVDHVLLVSAWRSKEHATEGVVQAASFVDDHLGKHVSPEQVLAGPVVLNRTQ